MKRIALIAALLAVTAARAQTGTDPDVWTPPAALLEELDDQATELELQGAQGPLDGYERYYRGTKRSGRLFVEGYFGSFQTEGKIADSGDLPTHVHIVTRAAPSVTNAGCRVIFLVYDVQAESFTSVQCEPGP
jgi:hypothetical protein